MGITSKSIGRMKSIMKKLDNELLKIAQEEKEKKKEDRSGKKTREA